MPIITLIYTIPKLLCTERMQKKRYLTYENMQNTKKNHLHTRL